MSLLKKLFGGGSGGGAKGPASEDYNGFRITPEPAKEAGGFRIGARIEREADGQTQTHMMIRADVCPSQDEAIRVSLLKAKSLIDQQGEAIFR